MHKAIRSISIFLVVLAGNGVFAQILISGSPSESWKEIVFSQTPITSELDTNGNYVAAVRLESLRRVMCSDSWWLLDDETLLRAAMLLKVVNDEIRPISPAFRIRTDEFCKLEKVSFGSHDPAFQLFLRQLSHQLFNFIKFSITEQTNADPGRIKRLKNKISRIDPFSESQRSLLASNSAKEMEPIAWDKPEEVATNMVEAVLKLNTHPKSAFLSFNGHYLEAGDITRNQILASCAIARISNSPLACNNQRDLDSIFAIAELAFFEIVSTQQTDDFPANYSAGLSLVGKINDLDSTMRATHKTTAKNILSEISRTLLTSLAPYFKSALGIMSKEQAHAWTLECCRNAKLTETEMLEFMSRGSDEK